MGKGERGVKLTRKEKERKILEMWRSGHTYKEICSALHVSTKTVSKVIRKVEEAEEEREPQARKEDIERLLKDVSKLRELYERLLKRLEIISQSFDGRLKNVEVRSYDLNKWREKVNDAIKGVWRLDDLAYRLRDLEAFCLKVEWGLLHFISWVYDLRHEMYHCLGYFPDSSAETWVHDFRCYLEERRRRREEEAKKLREKLKVRMY